MEILTKPAAPSAHSRAARRATSPSINTDKSLKEARAPAESIDQRPAILAAHHNSGVSKKSKRKNVMSRAARQRQERAAEMAEAVAERTAVKVQKSKASARVIESRKKTWDEINKDPVIKSKGAFAALAEKSDESDEDMDEDEEVQDAPVKVVPTPAAQNLHEQDEILLEDEEEIL